MRMSDSRHFNEKGDVRMVDVSDKAVTKRVAIASALLRMQPDTLRAILEDRIPKGAVLQSARIAGIMAAKETGRLIPLCHPLSLHSVEITIEPHDEACLRIEAQCLTADRTGVEMEALTAASVAALTVYDMCKAMDRGMVIERVQLEHKEGGRSGLWQRQSDDES